MKKIIISSLCMVALFASTALAGFSGPGTANVNSVKAAKSAKDDSIVNLEGFITTQITSDIYTFKDSTGTIEVEIDSEVWPYGVDISPETKVRIQGEIDKEIFSTQIDVDRIDVVK